MYRPNGQGQTEIATKQVVERTNVDGNGETNSRPQAVATTDPLRRNQEHQQ